MSRSVARDQHLASRVVQTPSRGVDRRLACGAVADPQYIVAVSHKVQARRLDIASRVAALSGERSERIRSEWVAGAGLITGRQANPAGAYIATVSRFVIREVHARTVERKPVWTGRVDCSNQAMRISLVEESAQVGLICREANWSSYSHRRCIAAHRRRSVGNGRHRRYHGRGRTRRRRRDQDRCRNRRRAA